MMTDMERLIDEFILNLPFQLGDRLVCILAFSQSFNPLILCGFIFLANQRRRQIDSIRLHLFLLLFVHSCNPHFGRVETGEDTLDGHMMVFC
jgi:hypothetical protein